MPLARLLAGVRSRRLHPFVLSLVLVLVALVPLADASPPDPVWIAGMYDVADFDEVVVAVVSASDVARDILVVSVKPADVTAEMVRPQAAFLGSAALASTFSIRAPPSAGASLPS